MQSREIAPDLVPAYAECRRVHRRHDPTYYFATRRLPAHVRPAVHALYGFVRAADEIVDGPTRIADPAARRVQLDALEASLTRARAGERTGDAAVDALADAGRRHHLPLDELEPYMESMRIDCAPVRIHSWEELTSYMDGSAAAVGRIMAPLLGAPTDAGQSFARLGQAFQLTNFIRDVREDFDLDRIYLPAEDRERFGVAEDEIARRHASEGFRALLAVQVERAHELFREGAPALGSVDASVRPGMRIARGVYLRVLDRVERLDYDVLARSAGLRPWEAVGAAMGSLRSAA